MKWKNTDTYKVLKQKIISNVVLVTEEIIDKYGAREISPFYISKSLFTNQELVDILNLFNLRSIKGGSYIIINEYNKSLPIKWNEIKQQYVVSNEYRVFTDGVITYMPIYNVMFLQPESGVIGEW